MSNQKSDDGMEEPHTPFTLPQPAHPYQSLCNCCDKIGRGTSHDDEASTSPYMWSQDESTGVNRISELTGSRTWVGKAARAVVQGVGEDEGQLSMVREPKGFIPVLCW